MFKHIQNSYTNTKCFKMIQIVMFQAKKIIKSWEQKGGKQILN